MNNRVEVAKQKAGFILGQVHGAIIPDTICDHGEGIYLYDQDGKKYIDFSGGAMVASIGHGDRRVAKAVVEQIEKVSYFFRGFWLNELLGELGEKIIRHAPPNVKWCQVCNSGSEATETAIKLALQYHLEKGNAGKRIVISRWQSYHGMTLGALSVSGLTGRRRKFSQLLTEWPKIGAPLCYHCPYGLSYPSCDVRCAWDLETAINQLGPENVAAFIAEPIGGASTAAMVPVPEYYPIIREICDRHDLLFIADEVICAFGRTGKWFGIEHWGVNPDLIITAKGMTGGYTAMASVLIDERIGNVFSKTGGKFIHGFTMEGNPVSCATCLAVLKIVEEDKLVQRSAEIGEYLHQQAKDKLSHHPTVGDIRGKGMLMGIELVKDKETKDPFEANLTAAYRVYQIAKGKGCMIYPTTGVVQGVKGDHFLIAPPFIITREEIDTALDILDEALNDFEKEFL
jgi:adenosylmethionine-8-amino-7-oxononanoate aminotransferase